MRPIAQQTHDGGSWTPHAEPRAMDRMRPHAHLQSGVDAAPHRANAQWAAETWLPSPQESRR